jgi:FkbM family methyltransferase
MSFVSYAQNFEDVLLNRVFGAKPSGFYVDVGAYHPVEGSVTKAFYDRGWSGINVEPGKIFDVLAAARPRDVNLHIAVLDRTGEASFLENNADHGMSKVINRLESQVPDTVSVVPCDTLSNIVAAHGQGRPIDFLKIDAEGSEGAIVGATDWRALRPTLLVVESTLPWTNQLANQDWEPALLAQGYRRVYFDGVNCFYVPAERTDVAAQFATPVNVLDGFARFDPGREELEVRVREAEAGLEQLHADDATLKGQHAETQDRLSRLKAEHAEAQDRLSQLQVDCNALAALAAELRATLDTTIADRDTLRHRVAALDRLLRESQSPRGPRSIAKRTVLTVFRPLRPVLRPIAWRIRNFLIAELRDEMTQLHGELQNLRQELALAEARLRGGGIAGAADLTPVLAEFSRTLEVTLLTLALGREDR